MTKVFAVSTGSYSDYRILGIYSTEEKAKKKIEYECSKSEYNRLYEYPIEVYTLDEHVDLMDSGFFLWRIRMEKDGSTGYNYLADEENPDKFIHTVRYEYEKYTLESTVWAKTEQEAVKIVNERRVNYIANNLWGKDLEDETSLS
jgi:hypothetical protein